MLWSEDKIVVLIQDQLFREKEELHLHFNKIIKLEEFVPPQENQLLRRQIVN